MKTTPFQTSILLRGSRGSCTAIRPLRAEIQALKVGDLAPDCFGRMSEVIDIFGRGDDIKGKAYVCYNTAFGSPGGKCSMSLKEGEISRDVQTTRFATSDEIRAHDLR